MDPLTLLAGAGLALAAAGALVVAYRRGRDAGFESGVMLGWGKGYRQAMTEVELWLGLQREPAPPGTTEASAPQTDWIRDWEQYSTTS